MEKIKKIGTDTFFCLFFLVCLLSSAAMSDNLPAGETGVDAGNVDSTRAALEKWVETRRIISQEKRDWAFGREMLTERIELVEREIESLKSKIREAEKNITETDKKRAGMVEENEKLKEASTALSSTVMTLEAHTGELLKRLPDPIRERVKPLSQRLPDNSDEAKLSLSERFQNIVGILNEINKFNRDITVTSEVHKLPDGTSAEVTAFYVGIGQAYYASSNGNAAGAGTASADGWIWTPANKAAAGILEAIAILKNEKAASFVQLPVEIQ